MTLPAWTRARPYRGYSAIDLPAPEASLDRGVLAIAAAVIAVLAAFASRYGYHRDELYFLAAGHHWPGLTTTRDRSRR